MRLVLLGLCLVLTASFGVGALGGMKGDIVGK
jgi:hypothetical protein